jgi:hypothetical protein
MAVSMRQVATGCLGLSGPISMTTGVFGYVFGLPSRPIALKRQLELAKGTACNLSVILVGHRNDFSGTISRADVARITFSIDRAREIYAQQSVGIRKLFWTHIPEEDVGNYAVITNQPEAEDLTDDWSASSNDGLDVFFVQSILNAAGWSTTPGPCDKSGKGMSGSVVELNNSDDFTGLVLAHEVGHYLGLNHANTITNLMGVDSNNDGIGEINSSSTGLTSSQGNTMKTHCSMKGAC